MKRPAAATPSGAALMKKPACAPSTATTPAPATGVAGKVMAKKATPTSPMKCEAPMKCKALIKNPTPATVFAAKQSIFKYPSVVDALYKVSKKKDRPAPKNQRTHYHGGHIYMDKVSGRHLRVFTRKGDRHEQRIEIDWKDKSDVAMKWALACSCIEVDSRPVK